MSEILTSWFMFPELTHGPFLAINLSNRKSGSKNHNDNLMARDKTGNWDIPAAGRKDGLKGKTVVLFYSTPQQSSRVYVGTINAHRIAGKTEHKPPRNRYELTAKDGWELVAETSSNFSEFFAGFRMSANPTVVWMDAQNYVPEPDRAADAENYEPLPVPPGISYMAWVALRENHRVFVKNVIRVWGRKCALTGIEAPFLIHAAHIVPWSVAKGEEKTTEHNGLMLCAHLHALFDGYQISFDDEGFLLLSSNISIGVRNLVLATRHTRLRIKPSLKQRGFLERHRLGTDGETKWVKS
ncbi:HNH endonuclease [Duganella sp. S19_KUP01_CR8]|uniref:HNH endonuclease n=1 Tax=Duganella sp. S19_KUP01_CR8 TaxID=3025502 RepID=UPI002FCD8FBB